MKLQTVWMNKKTAKLVIVTFDYSKQFTFKNLPGQTSSGKAKINFRIASGKANHVFVDCWEEV